MKTILVSLIVAFIVAQTASGFPQSRYRRETQKHVELSAEGEKKREELLEYVALEMMSMAKGTVDNHIELFEKVLKQVEASDLKSDALKEKTAKFTELIEKGKKLPEKVEKDGDIVTLLELFGKCIELAVKYDEIEKPTEEEKLFKRVLDENGAAKTLLQFFMDFIQLRTSYEEHIQKYVDSLSEEDKTKDAKFLKWFEKFKNADVDDYVDITMELFDYFGDDDKSKEKSEK